MGANGVASAAAAATAVLVYVALSSSGGGGEAARLRRPEEEDEEESMMRWPVRAPASWREAAAVAARTVGFTYRETLGRWPRGDIAFGIRHYMRIQVRILIFSANAVADSAVAFALTCLIIIKSGSI